ncbi:hypothetical protein AB0M28_07195 [Streptomyces sp. NPDC051940]|uniref:hypothetical protein n=1 Tax=Streptomyces sp. NPDC051940 TaxID=3155675 RepID=UPI00344204BD
MAENTDNKAMPDDPHVPLPEQAPSGAQGQLIDILQVIDKLFTGDGSLGSTNFENYSLEELVAFTQGGDPSRLTSAGDELFNAGKAFETAGNELKSNIGNVEWDGAAGESFRVWSDDFANKTLSLGEYAAAAGTQIKTAGEGLTEVKSAMPDNYTAQSTSWSTADKKSDPEAYQEVVAADRAEKNARRQEAIVQMNKLASYYQVTSSTLGAMEPPVFQPIDAAVPQPNYDKIGDGRDSSSDSNSTSTDRTSIAPADRQGSDDGVTTSPTGPTGRDTDPGLIPGHDPTNPSPTRPVGTDLDSVIVPTAPTGPAPTGPAPVSPGPVGPGPAPTAPTGGPPGYMPAPSAGPRGGMPPGSGPRTGPQSGYGPTSRSGAGPYGRTPTVGRSGTSPLGPGGRPGMGPTAPTGGRPGAVGRPGPVGPTAQAGGRGLPQGRGGVPGRPGVVGQSGGPGGGRAASGVGRGTIGGARPGAGGSRVPRGTVVGGEGVSSGRGGARSGAARGGAAEGRGLVGRGQRGFTRGGAGLAGRGPEDHEPETNESERPDYLVEDEETWTAGQGENGPGVVE